MFSNLFKESPYPVLIVDTDDGCFADVNEEIIKNIEYSREELIGKSPVELGIILPENELEMRKLIAEDGQFSKDFKELSVKEYLSSLVDDVLGNFPDSQIVKVEKVIQDFQLDAKRLQPLGIIINELLTNIMKYAFNGRDTGLITVNATNSTGHVTLFVQDNGIGMPESVNFENSSGFGLQLVQGLTQQLEGKIRIERGNGTKVVLEFDI